MHIKKDGCSIDLTVVEGHVFMEPSPDAQASEVMLQQLIKSESVVAKIVLSRLRLNDQNPESAIKTLKSYYRQRGWEVW
jgi:hypothetical protein